MLRMRSEAAMYVRIGKILAFWSQFDYNAP